MKNIAIIGGGIAGLEAAANLLAKGYAVVLIEKSDGLGGHVSKWDRLFPNGEKAERIITELLNGIKRFGKQIEICLQTELQYFEKKNGIIEITLTNNRRLLVDAVLICCGFDLFKAEQKEEYGYGIYDNVITSADLEKKFREGNVVCKNGSVPKRIAFVHCVGSRDEKVNNTYCSKVCCVTAVKQACEIKELYPDTEIFNLYMDLRMFDRYFENMYQQAQSKYGVQFIRGRLSETSENKEGRIVIKTEDTLIGKPLKIAVDMLVLMVGMQACASASELSAKTKVKIGSDLFFDTKDLFLQANLTNEEGVFLAGACTGPKTIPDTINDARSAAGRIHHYLS